MSLLSLSSRLATVLARGTAIRVFHLSTSPSRTDPLFSTAPAQAEEPTTCESHFLLITTPNTDDQAAISIFAIEVLVFTAPSLTTVFVSKADSTGYSSLLPTSAPNQSVTRLVVQTFITHLLQPRLSEPRVVLSLFARSQDQYLFPGSIENSGKHVLDDRQLIKWWCRVLDAVWRPHDLLSSEQQITAHLVVPGTERGEVRAYFPPSARLDKASAPKWSNEYPVQVLAKDVNAPPRCLIPRFPDDPKCRFLGDLDGDHIGEDGQWRSVKTLDQFWEFMSYRQECSAGRLVGFIWVAFIRPSDDTTGDPGDMVEAPAANVLPTPGDSQHQDGAVPPHQPPTGDQLQELLLPQSPPSSSPLVRPAAGYDETSATVTNGTFEGQEVSGPIDPVRETFEVPLKWPIETRGQIVTDAEFYEELIDVLLHLDFTGQQTAAESTAKWITSAKDKTQAQDFGVDVVGTAEPTVVLTAVLNGTDATPKVNTLIGVRKKRKVDDAMPAADSVSASEAGQALNVLSAGLVRKKPKT